jgi:hypothetical protein
MPVDCVCSVQYGMVDSVLANELERSRKEVVMPGIVNNESSRESADGRLLGSRVRIPPRAWMFVLNVVCFQVEVPATG